MVPPPVEIPTPNQPVKRMVSMSTPASAGTPIRVVISPNDDPRTEQYRRLAMLKKGLPFLDGLPPAALKELAEAGTPHRYEPGQKICSQGDTAEVEPSGGFPIYAVESGFPQALIDGEGRVQEYAPGDAFGELAPLTNQPRGASVQIHATGQPAELMVFSAEAVQAALSKWTDEERQGHYDALVQQYTQARALRRDPGLIAEIRELWNIMVRFCFSLFLARARPHRLYHGAHRSVLVMSCQVEESRRLTGRDLEGMVTREAYIALHLRVGKALQSEFDVKASENNANMDWAEDITAFSGEGARGCPPIRPVRTSILPNCSRR